MTLYFLNHRDLNVDDNVPLSLRYAPALQNASSRCKVLRSVLCLSRSAKHGHEAYACLCETTKDYMYIVLKRIDISQPVRRRQQLSSRLRHVLHTCSFKILPQDECFFHSNRALHAEALVKACTFPTSIFQRDICQGKTTDN